MDKVTNQCKTQNCTRARCHLYIDADFCWTRNEIHVQETT